VAGEVAGGTAIRVVVETSTLGPTALGEVASPHTGSSSASGRVRPRPGSEALVLGVKAGLDPEAVLAARGRSTGPSRSGARRTTCSAPARTSPVS
jgi:hypothetical protein